MEIKRALSSIFGKMDKTDDPDEKHGMYVFFGVNSQHPNYECVRNVVKVQSYVAEFKLNDYPIREERYSCQRARSMGYVIKYCERWEIQFGLGQHRNLHSCIL